MVPVAATVISATQAVRASRAQVQVKNSLVISEAARQEAEIMTKFLTEIFQSPDPKQDGRTVTVAETLGRAARRIETDLADHPERRRIWALGTLGETYEAAGRRNEAIKIYEDVLTISREVNGEDHGRTRWAVNKIAAITKRSGATNQWDAPQAEAKSAATTGQPLN